MASPEDEWISHYYRHQRYQQEQALKRWTRILGGRRD